MDHYTPTFLNCGLFTNIDQSDLPKIIDAFKFKKYSRNSILIMQNDIPGALYILHKGSIGIFNEDILLTELNPPSCIGESCIANTTATATSIANSDIELFEIKSDDFLKLAEQYPRIIQNMFTITIQRLRRSNDLALKEARNRTAELKYLVEKRTEELNKTLKELTHTQQFRDQFLANMSHEIRTPMNAIVGLTNLLVQTKLDEQQGKYLEVIRKSGDNLLVIINDILDLSKIEAGKMELEKVSFSLIAMLETLKTILFVKSEQKGIKLEIETSADLPLFIIGDETRLTQILMNLAGNAIKFTETGWVKISATVLNKKDDLFDIQFTVEDTGIGIPIDKQEKIFESFGQAASDITRKYGGTGLGLSISKQLVELHQSELKVNSHPDKGSKFYFTISFKQGEKQQTPPQYGHQSNNDLNGKKILLVEDNAFNQMVANDTIEQLFPGIRVDIAENGRTAIAMASSTDYDLILMDIQLPDIDGFEITKFIRTELTEPRKHVPICALTASVSTERIQKCLKAGMNDYLFKPFDTNDLKEKLLINILHGEKHNHG